MERFEMPNTKYADDNDRIAEDFDYVACHFLGDEFYDTDSCEVTVTDYDENGEKGKVVEIKVYETNRCSEYGIRPFEFDWNFWDDESLKSILNLVKDSAIEKREETESKMEGKEEEEEEWE